MPQNGNENNLKWKNQKNYKDYIPYLERQFTFHCCLNFSCMHWIYLLRFPWRIDNQYTLTLTITVSVPVPAIQQNGYGYAGHHHLYRYQKQKAIRV